MELTMEISNKQIEDYLNGKLQLPEIPTIRISDAEYVFNTMMTKLLGNSYVKLPEYNDVISWLIDSNGKGLALIGNNGRGKSLIANYIIPAILFIGYNKVVTCVEMPNITIDNLDEYKTKKFISLDDIGTESQIVEYGSRRWAFPEIMDAAEKRKNLVVFTSNEDADGIEAKYGIRTRERIRSTCRVVVFNGESQRR